MLAEERLDRIMSRLRQQGTLAVDEIAEDFGISVDTARRDCNRLAERSLVRRTHGGILLPRQDRDSSTRERELKASAEKAAIARRAAEMIEDHDTIALDAGSTTALIVDLIEARDVTIITYSVEIACRAIRRENLSVYVAGGMVRPSTGGAVGEDAVRMLRSMQAEKGFIGANGIDLVRGLMTPNYHEAAVKKALLEISRSAIVVADSTKFHQTALTRFGTLDDVDILVTDDGIPPDLRTDLFDHPLETIIVSRSRNT